MSFKIQKKEEKIEWLKANKTLWTHNPWNFSNWYKVIYKEMRKCGLYSGHASQACETAWNVYEYLVSCAICDLTKSPRPKNTWENLKEIENNFEKLRKEISL